MTEGVHGDGEVRIRLPNEAVSGRDYTIYTRAMDEAVAAKYASMWPVVGEISDGAVIADIGSGTGAFAQLVAERLRESRPTVLAVDRSHELIEYAANKYLINLVFDEATSLAHIPDNSVDVMTHGTIGHEIYSETGNLGLQQSLVAALRVLKPGGREVWRDMVKPTYTGNVLMRIDVADGVDAVDKAITNGFLDYTLLSTRALFERFHKEFLGGNAFSYRIVTIKKNAYIELPAEFAHEFMLRKDYTANWRQEIKEKYTYWTFEEAKAAFENAGFPNVTVVPDDSTYIRDHRFRGKVTLFTQDENGELQEIEFPTHMVVAANKPGEVRDGRDAVLPHVDYDTVLASVAIDSEHGKITIGDRIFAIGAFVGQGSHKRVYKNEEDAGKTVIKVVRKDERDVHNVFKSMLQAIERQPILEDYDVPHMHIRDYDHDGPPYRYIIQDALPENAVSAAILIRNQELSDPDIAQIAGVVNRFEEGKRWQLDMSPYNWHRVMRADGTTQMVYTGSTVYTYDERWAFGSIGLLQWSDPRYVPVRDQQSSVIPSREDIDHFLQTVTTTEDPTLLLWKEHLSASVFPSS